MTLLQNSQASEAVLGGQSFFRISQPLGLDAAAGVGTGGAGSGDAFEFDVSLRGLSIGPDSDIDSVKVFYYDVLAPALAGERALLSSIDISVGHPFRGRIDAAMGTQFTSGAVSAFGLPAVPGPVETTARIVAFPGPLIAKGFIPDAAGAASIIARLDPQIDLIGSFDGEIEAVSARAPRVLDTRIEIAADPSFVVMPFYGRRFGTFDVRNQSAGVYTVTVRGHNLSVPFANSIETVLLTGTAIAAGNSLLHSIDSSTDGSFDMISLQIAGAALTGAAEPPPIVVRAEVRDG